jgi:predicted amidohydrolase
MQISAVQFLILKDADKNIAKAKAFIEKESGKSDLIVFPELFLNCKYPDHAPFLVKMFCRLSSEYKIDIVPGSMLTTRSGKTYNTSYYISKGKVVAKYDKASPWKSEKVDAGAFPKPFKTIFGKTALIICWDLANPSISAHLSELDVDVIVCPAMWWKGKESGANADFAGEFIDALCRTRSYESRAAVVYANAAGILKFERFSDLSAGRSQIAVPTIKAKIASSEKEQVVRSAFDKKRLAIVKKYFDGKV